MRPSIRLASMMKSRSIFVFTHDSIFLGEDGPTHQPIEHLSCLRMIPDLTVWRPGDGLETAMAWSWMTTRAEGAACICLTRQNVPVLEYPKGFDPTTVYQGGYVLREEAGAQVTLVGTGSELSAVVEAAELLKKQGLTSRIVSMPSTSLFQRQNEKYRKSVLGTLPITVVEAGSTPLWKAMVGSDALVIGIDTFGVSGPAPELARKFGLTPPQIAETVGNWLKKKK